MKLSRKHLAGVRLVDPGERELVIVARGDALDFVFMSGDEAIDCPALSLKLGLRLMWWLAFYWCFGTYFGLKLWLADRRARRAILGEQPWHARLFARRTPPAI